MKKVLLTGTALLAFAAAGFAQGNTTSTFQNGNSQTASQTQSGNYLKSTISQDKAGGSNTGNYAGTLQNSTGSAGNEAAIEQNLNANSNRAFVTQQGGTGNKGVIQQDNASGKGALAVTAGTSAADVKAAGGNWSGILQQGSNNTNTYIYQNNTSNSNFGEIYQYGSSNKQTSIDQSNNSTGNRAVINQGTSTSPAKYNEAIIAQQGDSHDNKAEVTQVSQSNVAFVKQNDKATANETTIKQIGNAYNENAQVYQSSNANNNKADVTQSGYYDKAIVHQENNSQSNQATIKQGTNDFSFFSTATINQYNNASNGKAMITQDGDSHVATITQENDARRDQATITQNGSSNTATTIQNNAFDNQATTNQNGSENVATTKQVYADYNQATINQSLVRPEGGSNTAEILQGDGSFYSSHNTATINQDFSKNTAKLQQLGGHNTANLSQMVGDLNVIKGVNGDYALQQGTYNTMTVTQNSGNGDAAYVPNTASVTQIGNSNTATIMQMGRSN